MCLAVLLQGLQSKLKLWTQVEGKVAHQNRTKHVAVVKSIPHEIFKPQEEVGDRSFLLEELTQTFLPVRGTFYNLKDCLVSAERSALLTWLKVTADCSLDSHKKRSSYNISLLNSQTTSPVKFGPPLR